MKILSAEQIRAADAHTISTEPILSIDLMERAAEAFTNSFILNVPQKEKPIWIYCGMGNNGGDGLAIGRMLDLQGYSIQIVLVNFTDILSADANINYHRLPGLIKDNIIKLRKSDNHFNIPEDAVLIDAIFGSGLSRPLEGWLAELIHAINNQDCEIHAVDIPSGLFTDKPTSGATIKANYTYSFQVPKLSFMIPESGRNVGTLILCDIGLDKQFVEDQNTDYFWTERGDIKSMLKNRESFDHKGNYGHTLLAAGSYGKMGAAILAGKAAMRSGLGLLTMYIPKCGYDICQTALPEAMVITDSEFNHISTLSDIHIYNSLGLGPGIGTEKNVSNALKAVLKLNLPKVLDADAINILAADKKLMKQLDSTCILTPHPGEFDRLFGKSQDGWERLKKARAAAKKHGVILVLKGKNTSVIDPYGVVYFNSTGNSGMATAGSGDVLTGILSALLCRYSTINAARIGVYLHGLAGDFAALKMGRESLIASDVIDHLGTAHKSLEKDA